MGEVVRFPSNGNEGQGYLAVPESGSGPGVVVLQEWWGLNAQIKEVCDRFASEGFVALAPDIYRGEVTTEPDEAGKLMMALNIEQAAKDMAGAVDFLVAHAAVTSTRRRRHRLLHGRRSRAVARDAAARRRARGRAVLRRHPVARPPSPTTRDAGQRCRATTRENDDFAGPPAVAALEDQLHGGGQALRVLPLPGYRARVHEPPPARGVPRGALRDHVGSARSPSSARHVT